MGDLGKVRRNGGWGSLESLVRRCDLVKEFLDQD